jgi:hypothetical protein
MPRAFEYLAALPRVIGLSQSVIGAGTLSVSPAADALVKLEVHLERKGRKVAQLLLTG